MKKTIEYLKEYIDDNAEYRIWNEEARKKLSLQLAGAFDFYRGTILGETVLFLKPSYEMTVSTLQKRMETIEEKIRLHAVAVLDEVSPYAIKKMLMDKTAFVVAGKQMNLPFLAMRIKNESYREQRKIKRFTPGTQMVYLYALYAEEDEIEINRVAQALAISPMTVVRGLKDLTEAGLLTFEISGWTGRKKVYHRIDHKDFYLKGKKYMIDPVREMVSVREISEKYRGLVKSGLTALAELTMLGEPEQTVYAMPSRDRGSLKGMIISRDEAVANNWPIIQLMKYDVGVLGWNGYADPISIMLSITDRDERIQMAIDELMEKYDWYVRENME